LPHGAQNPKPEQALNMIKPSEIQQNARDFFDIWYLLEEHGIDIDLYLSDFATKCKSPAKTF